MSERIGTWASLLAASPPGCGQYRTVLDEAIRGMPPDDGDLPLMRALAEVAALVLDPEDAQRPLRPVFPGASREVVQFDVATLDSLKGVLEHVPVDLRARIRDVLWIVRRGAEVASTRTMIGDYCDAAEALARVHAGGWDAPRARLSRALAVAASMKWAEGVDAVGDRLRMLMRGADWDASTRVQAAELLVQRWEGADAAEAARLVEAIAESVIATAGEEPFNWDWPRYALEVASEACRRAGDADGALRLRLRRAKAFLLQERWLMGRTGVSPLIRVNVLESALTAYRDAGAGTDVVDPVHARLREVQRESMTQMKPYRGPSIDLAACANESVAYVRGLSFSEAVRALTHLAAPPQVDDLRKRARESRDLYPLSFLFPRRRIDRDGRTVAVQVGAFDPTDADLVPAMFEQARVHQQVLVRGSVNPARAQITAEHPGDRHEWFVFLGECPLVHPRRRRAVAIGLAAGLHGDFITSASILAPQLEHMIRTLVAAGGAVTTTFDTTDGTQREAALSKMLARPELAAAIGADLVFDLRGLLDDAAGANIRNRIAHGLLDDDELMSGEALYLWFSTLRLIALVSLVDRPADSVGATQDDEDEDK